MSVDFRSLLFAPGNRDRLVQKAPLAGADAVIFDLEDAVPITEKVAARGAVAMAVACGVDGPPRFVRINALDTLWSASDAAEVVSARLFGVVLPKAESAADIQSLDALLASVEAAAGQPLGGIEILPILETARGILRAGEIAAGGPRVRRIAFGAYDYARDMDIALTAEGDELLVARTNVTLAARAARIQALDTVYAAVADELGLLADARRARGLGFSGKLCIHPAQIEPIHSVFSPSPDEVKRAARIVAAFRSAEADGRAAIALDGQLVDYPIAMQQERLLEKAERLGLAIPSLTSESSISPRR